MFVTCLVKRSTKHVCYSTEQESLFIKSLTTSAFLSSSGKMVLKHYFRNTVKLLLVLRKRPNTNKHLPSLISISCYLFLQSHQVLFSFLSRLPVSFVHLLFPLSLLCHILFQNSPALLLLGLGWGDDGSRVCSGDTGHEATPEVLNSKLKETNVHFNIMHIAGTK